MATERVIDLEHQRYADLPYEGVLPAPASAAEAGRAAEQARALEFLRSRVSGAAPGPFYLSVADLASLLTVLGLDE